MIMQHPAQKGASAKPVHASVCTACVVITHPPDAEHPTRAHHAYGWKTQPWRPLYSSTRLPLSPHSSTTQLSSTQDALPDSQYGTVSHSHKCDRPASHRGPTTHAVMQTSWCTTATTVTSLLCTCPYTQCTCCTRPRPILCLGSPNNSPAEGCAADAAGVTSTPLMCTNTNTHPVVHTPPVMVCHRYHTHTPKTHPKRHKHLPNLRTIYCYTASMQHTRVLRTTVTLEAWGGGHEGRKVDAVTDNTTGTKQPQKRPLERALECQANAAQAYRTTLTRVGSMRQHSKHTHTLRVLQCTSP